MTRYAKYFVILSLLIPLFASAHAGEPHVGGSVLEESAVTEGAVVNLNAKPVPYISGTTTELEFIVTTKPGNEPVLYGELEMDHSKLLHAYGVRSDLTEFFHVFPTPDASSQEARFSTDYVFAKPGLYKLWSSIASFGTRHTYSHPEMSVRGEGPIGKKEISLGTNIVVGDNMVGNYQVSMSGGDRITKDRAKDISFLIHTATGNGALLENYVDEVMHLTAIKEDMSEFIHQHPEVTEAVVRRSMIPQASAHGEEEHEQEAELVSFRLTFPSAGFYKLFLEFRPANSGLADGAAMIGSFWVEVTDRAVSVEAQWWILLVSSFVLMALLSLGVRKYIGATK